jgi:hypothetical protein
VTPSGLHVEQIDAPVVVAFLNHLEATRANRPSSRNVRLAAIKSFMHFLEFREPAAIDQIRRILPIPPKKADTRLEISPPGPHLDPPQGCQTTSTHPGFRGGARRQLLPRIGVIATAAERLHGSSLTADFKS